MPQIIADALSLMLAGMGTVFFFLLLSVLVITITSRLVQIFSSAKEGDRLKAPVSTGFIVNEQKIAAVAAIAFAQRQQHSTKN